MKKMNWIVVTILLMIGAGMYSCKNKPANETVIEPVEETALPSEVEETYLTAVENYFIHEIGSQYSQAQVCIPCLTIVDVDESNAEDIRVWGDFWVFNYDISGDTLKTVSGGSHPGLVHVKKSDKGFDVVGFDRVEDGAGNLASAKKIFGDKYDAFHAINSDSDKREAYRAKGIADYVKKNNLRVSLYQDFGWPAIRIPKE